ncbi:MAG: glutamine-hydrolyzing carbamoyl-phosphate synthase small subunit [Proteobacteria bacterium]|nr:glutamine-hydrolyzing carbamoyl-phosphate synthase small subunit [Pseudomonadota bacterium]
MSSPLDSTPIKPHDQPQTPGRDQRHMTDDQSLPPGRSYNLASKEVKKAKIGRLILSNGTVLEGYMIGDHCRARGELVFTTSLVGYSESLTDPSYFGQILTFAYPLIGNYGIPEMTTDISDLPPPGYESNTIHASGVIINATSDRTFHWRSLENLDSWLQRHGVPGLYQIDTRHLIHVIRENTPLLGRIEPMKNPGAKERALAGWSPPEGDFFDASEHLILPYVSRQEPMLYQPSLKQSKTPRVCLVDCGVKNHIVRELLRHGCEVLCVPWNTCFDTIDCSGWLISNGPGDPAYGSSLISEIKKLLTESRPILGICLGHQLLGLAAGMLCERMTFGHRSHNQPVYEVGEKKCYMTSQNHGFHLIEDLNWPCDWQVWFRNANDQSIEGIRHKSKPFRSVQFHPEASSGPQDTSWIIEDFAQELAASLSQPTVSHDLKDTYE